MKHVVIVQQEENWEDDGGSHDPWVAEVSDEQLAVLDKLDRKRGISVEERDWVLALPTASVTFPCEIHGVFNFWYSFG